MRHLTGRRLKANDALASARITSRERDRSGDVVEPRGAQLQNYWKNPIVKLQHGGDPAMGSRPIGRMVDLAVGDEDIVGTWRWSDTPAAQEIRQMWQAGVYNAVSVGFLPLKYEPMPDGRGYRFLAWELLEVSVVDIPACSSCVRVDKCATCRRAREEARWLLVDGGGAGFELDARELAAFIGERMARCLRKARGIVD